MKSRVRKFPPKDSPFRNQTEAARFLRVSERTLERWRREELAPIFRKLGKGVVYHIDDLIAFADAGARRSTHEAERHRSRPV